MDYSKQYAPDMKSEVRIQDEHPFFIRREWDGVIGGFMQKGDEVFNEVIEETDLPEDSWEILNSIGTDDFLVAFLNNENISSELQGEDFPTAIADYLDEVYTEQVSIGSMDIHSYSRDSGEVEISISLTYGENPPYHSLPGAIHLYGKAEAEDLPEIPPSA